VYIEATLADTPAAFRSLGRLLKQEAAGEKLARYCEAMLARKNAVMAKVGNEKVSVVYCLGANGLNVLAQGTYHAEVLDELTVNSAVMRNPTSFGGGNDTDVEQLLVWNPAVLLFADAGALEVARGETAWQQLAAMRTGRCYAVPIEPYNWLGAPPACNRYLGMLYLLKLLYPQYADFDLYEAVKEYYDLFYHHALTRDEYAALMRGAF
jgi:iron complex transport system substrate-binding protein